MGIDQQHWGELHFFFLLKAHCFAQPQEEKKSI